MNLLSICLLSILLPILLVALFIASYIILKWWYYKKYTTYFIELENFISSEPYVDTFTTLRTVDFTLQEHEKTLIEKITSSTNDEIKINEAKIQEINENKDNFAKKTIDLEEKIKKIKNLKKDMEEKLDNSKFFTCRRIVKEIEKEKKEIEDIRNSVNKETKKYINPIIDFENKKYHYQKIVNKFERISRKWNDNIQRDDFQKNIESLITNINNYLGEATEYLSKGDQDEAINSFSSFKKNLYHLIVFANNFEKIENVLFMKSTDIYKKTIEYIENVKNNLKSNLDNLNINDFLNNINQSLATAKEEFLKLNINETIENINNYYDSLIALTQSITNELNAFNLFSQYGVNDIQELFESATIRYFEIKNSCEQMLQVDKMFYWNLQPNIEELGMLIKEIKLIQDQFINDFESKEIPISTKQFKFKKILSLYLSFFENAENCEKTINVFYSEGASQGLKYNRLKKIYIDGLSDLKKFNIKLSIEDNELINKIENKKSFIENNVINSEDNNYSEKDLKMYIDDLFILIEEFILKVFKKVLFVKIFSIINIEYSYKRINNNYFDKKMNECEELILDGEYEQGLKLIIENIKGIKN